MIAPVMFLHCFLTWVMAYWFFALGMPGNALLTAPALAGFEAIMPEFWWAITFGVIAVIGILGIMVKRLTLPSRTILSVGHLTVGVLIILAAPLNPGAGVYGGLAVAAVYLIVADHA